MLHNSGMKIGYARISTRDQDPQLQIDALQAAGVDKIVTEKASGKDRKRPVLEATLAELGEGDELVVWKIDRLGRSVLDLETIIKELGERGATFRSITEPQLNTGGPAGDLVRTILSAVAQYERALIRERITNGVAAARKQGRIGGRRPKLTDDDLDLLVELWDRGVPVTTLAEKWNVDKATIYRAHAKARARQSNGAPR
jgi:DNA invertase Pin-like site-specific DNA recombinase